MKVNLNIVEKLVGFKLPPVDELVARVNAQLGGVEEIIDLGAKYKDATIVRVVECEKHPNADKLSVCKIDAGDDGQYSTFYIPNSNLIQVACGAPNVHADMSAIWLPPDSTVPATFDDAKPFVLGARELRGVMSHGMLAAADELGIGTDHSGIIEIAEKDITPQNLQSGEQFSSSSSAELLQGDSLQQLVGRGFAEVFGLDGYTIDIENKMFTHRPDLFGQLGVAREIAGIFGKQFISPDWYKNILKQVFSPVEGSSFEDLEVFNDAPENVPRFMAVAMRDVEVGESPLWLKCQLVAMGAKPINNIVDATNYAMLMTAQPTHAYDYDKLHGHKIGVRMAENGEKVTLLNEKTYELTPEDIVIVDGEGVIGLGGVMGGLDSEVTNETKNIVLEVANFDMYTIRKTSMRHGLFTDAVTRFNKGQSPLQNGVVLSYLMQMTGGTQASGAFDMMSPQVDECVLDDKVSLANGLGITSEFIGERLGLDFEDSQIKELLENVEIKVDIDERGLSVFPPFWRTDIEQPEDIVEEVGRLYGFDRLPRELPSRSTSPATKNTTREVKRMVRDSLSRHGANEVLTYSFVHENIFKKAEQDASQAFKLSNALSPDLQYFRLSVLPSLLDKVHANIKAGHDEFVLFEIGKGHNKKYHPNDDEGLPREMNFVDAVYASKKPKSGAPYYHVRRLVQQLCLDQGLTLVYKPITDELDFPVTAPFDLSRSALLETEDGTFIGMMGELKQSVLKNFKLPAYTAAMTLDLEGLEKAFLAARQTYQPLSRYPSVTQDVSLTVPTEIAYETVFEKVSASAEHDMMQAKITPVSIYQSDAQSTTKTITLRLTFTSDEKTLSDKDIAPIMQNIEKITL